MNVLDALRVELADHDLRLRKATPRGPERMLVEVEDSGGGVHGAQWLRDPAEAAQVAGLLRDRFGDGRVQLRTAGRVVVQRDGADRKLPRLGRLAAEPGAVLVAHRPERRGVVRVGEDRYTKVVRKGETAGVARPLTDIRPPSFRVPEVLEVDDEGGLVTISAMRGRTLHDRLLDSSIPAADLAADGHAVGAAMRTLHEHRAPVRRQVHDGTAEMAAALRMLSAADDYGLLPAARWRTLADDAARNLSGPPTELGLLHRDLHDKQLILHDGDPVALLDLDLAAYGDPALDLANLLVHLDLRIRQQLCEEERARACAAGVLDGYQPSRGMVRRLPSYVASTRLRLAGLYSFRGGPEDLVPGLLDADPGQGCWTEV